MSGGKHTAGPWKFLDATKSARHQYAPTCIIEAGPKQIASFSWHDNSPWFPTKNQSQANARLIAAAPDLLEVAVLLEKAEEAHANCDECGGEEVPELCPKCFPLFDDARLKRRAAIAKAEGRAP